MAPAPPAWTGGAPAVGLDRVRWWVRGQPGSARLFLGARKRMMGIAQKVSRDFNDAVRSRGQSYFAKGRVVITGANAGEVVARVRGTAKYRVRLRLRGGK